MFRQSNQMPHYNLGIAGPFSELVERIRKDHVNDVWAQLMLQRIIENDHTGDKELLCKPFLHLLRPTLKEIAEFLENPADGDRWTPVRDRQTLGNRTPVDEKTLKALSGFNFMEEPGGVSLVRLNASSFFENSIEGWSERKIREKAHEMYDLVPCPMWVIPAIAMKSKAGGGYDNHTQMNVCVSEEHQQKSAFNVIYGVYWWIHLRSGSLDTTWGTTSWLMAKPLS